MTDFKLAQKLLIVEVIEYQKLLAEAKAKLKEVRRLRDKKSEVTTIDTINTIEERLRAFSHIADGIAWQMIGGEIHIARRFYIGERNLKQLNKSNLDHAIRAADGINKNPDDFALISDLTGFVQMGDLIVRYRNRIGIIELKEGKVNEQITGFLGDLDISGARQLDEEKLKETFDAGTIKQIKRMLRQQERMMRAGEVLQNDKGVNPATGEPITVYTPSIPTERYHDVLAELHKLN